MKLSHPYPIEDFKGAYEATTKGRILKIQFLHDVIDLINKHVESAGQKADTLIKQFPSKEFKMHLSQSLQLYPREQREPSEPTQGELVLPKSKAKAKPSKAPPPPVIHRMRFFRQSVD